MTQPTAARTSAGSRSPYAAHPVISAVIAILITASIFFSLYVPPSVGITLLEAIKSKQPKEVYLNPGSESDALIARAEALGLEPILACSIIEIGERP